MLIVSPQRMRTVGIAADNAEARTEIRAMYGGLEIGIALFLLISLFREEWLRSALTFQLFALGALAVGRLVGIALEAGRVRGLLWFFAAIEVAAAGITYLALVSL